MIEEQTQSRCNLPGQIILQRRREPSDEVRGLMADIRSTEEHLRGNKRRDVEINRFGNRSRGPTVRTPFGPLQRAVHLGLESTLLICEVVKHTPENGVNT